MYSIIMLAALTAGPVDDGALVAHQPQAVVVAKKATHPGHHRHPHSNFRFDLRFHNGHLHVTPRLYPHHNRYPHNFNRYPYNRYPHNFNRYPYNRYPHNFNRYPYHNNHRYYPNRNTHRYHTNPYHTNPHHRNHR